MALTPIRTTVLGDTGDLSAEPGSPRWIKAVYFKACSAVNDATKTREYVETWVGALLERNNYQQLADDRGQRFMFWSDFCAARQPFGLGYSPEAIEALLLQRPTTAQLAEKAAPIAKQGRPLKVDEKGSDTTFVEGRGSEYLTARIARDRPDVLEGMKRGEYPSVRSAAKAAGIVSERWSVPSNPIQLAAYLCRRFTSEELDQLVSLLGNRQEADD